MAINKAISIIVFGMAILFIGSQCLFAEENLYSDEIVKEISNNVSEEYITCAAYFSIVSEAMRRSGDAEVASKYEAYRDLAVQYALIAAKEGRTQEMAERVSLARFELNVKSMTNEIDNDIGNISILLNKYSARCKEIMEDPEKVMVEWGDKILEKHKLK